MNIINTNQQTGRLLLLGHSIAFWIIVGVLAFVFIVALNAFLTTALIRVSYAFGDQARKGDVSLAIIDSKGEEKKLALAFGNLAFVPRSATAISARTTDSETRAIIQNLPYFAVPTFKLTLQAQQMASKLGANTQGCNLVNQNGTFTHSCDVMTNLARINRPDNGLWDTAPVTPPPHTISARYEAGFLTFQQRTPQLSYFIPGGDTQQFSMPDDFMKKSTDKIVFVTNQSTTTDHAFIIANITTGEFMLVPSLDGAQKLVRFSRKIETNPQFNVSLCAMNTLQLACYYGPQTDDHSNLTDHKNYREEHKTGQFEVVSLKNVKESSNYEVSNIENIDDVFMSAAGNTYALRAKSLYAVSFKNNSLQARLVSANVNSVGTSGASLFFTAGSSVFELNEKESTAYLRFHSNNIASPRLSVQGGTVLINAFVNAPANNPVSAFAHVYQLTSAHLGATQNRREDFLPYKDYPHITYMDYDDTRIYIALRSIYTTDASGRRALDEVKINAQQEPIRQKLQNDGLLTDQTRLLFK